MKCPDCGDEDRQRRIGRLHQRPDVLYHCQVCEKLYGVEDDGSDDDRAGEEE